MTRDQRLTSAQTDRAAGALLGTACGDALGAGYEFGPPLGSSRAVAMVGGGSFGWAPGEWTDDTSMAIAIAEVTADGGSLRDQAGLDLIADHAEVWLADSADSGRNPNLDLVLAQAADAVAVLRAEGRTVLIHCVDAVSRTPAVAALYAARHLGIPVQQALRDVRSVLPAARPNPAFIAALDRLGAVAASTA